VKSLSGAFSITGIITWISGNIFRVLSFFDKGRLVILINGFQKKSQQTLKKEIEKAEKLKKQYFDEKNSK